MAKHHHHQTPDVSHVLNPDIQHERSDVNVGLLAKFILALFIGTVIVLVAMFGLFRYFERREERHELPPASLVVAPGTRIYPPEPRLQGAPGPNNVPSMMPLNDIAAYRSQIDARLNSYGWIDQSAGVAHIPIEEAMKLVAARGGAREGQGGTASSAKQ